MEHIRKIFEARGYNAEEIESIMGGNATAIVDELAKLGYDSNGKPLAIPVPGAMLELAAETLFDEYTLSGSAENTLNIGNYSSAKRGVFVGRKLQVPRDLPEAERFKLLTSEVKKLQFLAEAQLSGICKEAMGPNGFNDTSWHKIVSGVFTNAMARAKDLFGVGQKAAAE